MMKQELERKYPENMKLKELVRQSGRSGRWYANKIGVSEKLISDVINGKYKGSNIVPKLLSLINQ